MIDKNNQKLKVLFITRKWPPAVGGMEKYSFKIVRELAKTCNLTTKVLPGKQNGSPPGLLSIFTFFISSIKTCVFNKSMDVIHLGDLVLWPLAVFTHIRNKRAKIFIFAHGTDIAYPLRLGLFPKIYGIYLSAGVFITRKYLTVIANSTATKNHCLTRGFVNTYVVPLGVDLPVLGKIEYIKEDKYILFVGRLAERKGAAWFVTNVLPLLSENIKLKVAGTKWDDSEWRVISASKRVKFLGPVFGENLAELRRNAIAVIMPNLTCGGKDFEGFGLTALEACADGGVLLASNIDGIVDAVIPNVTGFLLPSKNSASWVDNIKSIDAWNERKRFLFIKKARMILDEKYSWNRVALDITDIYYE